MAVETATYIDDLNPATIGDGTDPVEGGRQVALIKQVLQNTINLGGAVTASAAELNYLDLTTLGTAENSKALVVDGSGNLNASAVTFTNLGTVTTVDVNGGSIDGTTIGASSAAAGTFTNLTVTGTFTGAGGTVDGTPIGGSTPSTGAFTTLTASSTVTFSGTLGLASGTTVNEFSIDGTLAGDSDNAVPTEKAVKTYIDTQIAALVDVYALQVLITDVSTAETTWVVVPVAGTVVRMDTVLAGAITSADATVSVTTKADAAMGSVVVSYTGSAAGDVDSTTSITNSSVTAGQALKVKTNGNSSTARKLWVTLLIEKS